MRWELVELKRCHLIISLDGTPAEGLGDKAKKEKHSREV